MKTLIFSFLLCFGGLSFADTVRCYFPGHSEKFEGATSLRSNKIWITLSNGTELLVPVNACILEQDKD